MARIEFSELAKADYDAGIHRSIAMDSRRIARHPAAGAAVALSVHLGTPILAASKVRAIARIALGSF